MDLTPFAPDLDRAFRNEVNEGYMLKRTKNVKKLKLCKEAKEGDPAAIKKLEEEYHCRIYNKQNLKLYAKINGLILKETPSNDNTSKPNPTK